MAMTQGQQSRDEMADQLQAALRDQQRRIESLAQQLSRQSLEQWQRAVEGMIALPAAIVTGAASWTLFAVSFVTRGFEIFEEMNERQQQQAAAWRRRDNSDRRDRDQLGGEAQLGQNTPRA
jgi:hypothetical protein